ncbi:MAG: hypothetical protein ACFFEE_04790 [Candidatus Thorarchaeota archaeon]
MSTQGQWEEQLIAEWKSLQGYFVETNIGLTVTEKGGLNEVDILAVRIDGKSFIVEHIEVGNLGRKYSKNLAMILKKFSDEQIEAAKKYVASRLNVAYSFKWDYRCKYIYTWGSRINDLRAAIKKKEIELLYLSDLIHINIPQALSEWRQKRVDSGLVKETNPDRIILPRKYRLLTLLDNTSRNRVV